MLGLPSNVKDFIKQVGVFVRGMVNVMWYRNLAGDCLLVAVGVRKSVGTFKMLDLLLPWWV